MEIPQANLPRCSADTKNDPLDVKWIDLMSGESLRGVVT